MKYYTIVTSDILNSIIPNEIKEFMDYPDGVKLIDCCISHRELEDGTFAISVNLANKIYLPNKCAISNMNYKEVELAKLMYGENNILTQEQYNNLNFKQDEKRF